MFVHRRNGVRSLLLVAAIGSVAALVPTPANASGPVDVKSAMLTASPASGTVTYGDGTTTVTLTMTVTGKNTTSPTGTVSFTAGGPSITANCSNVPLTTVSGVVQTANCTATVAGAGQTTGVQASYSGDGNYNPKSDSLKYTIAQATPTVKISAPSPGSPVTYGTSVTLVATVTGAGSPYLSPSGTVDFTLTSPATAIPNCAGVTLSGTTATCTTTMIPGTVGAQKIKATYNGDGNYASNSDTTGNKYTVNSATPTVQLTANPASPGTYPSSSTTLTATVSGVTGGADPTGTVTFSQGGGAIATCSAEPLSMSPPQATCAVTGLTVGTTGFSVAYTSGDANYTNGSATLSYMVGSASPTVVLSANPTSSTYPGSTELTATVSGVVGGADPTGTVTFSNGGAEISGCIDETLAGTGSPPAPTCSVSDLAGGTAHFSVSYSGDGNYSSGSNTLDITVNAATPTVMLSTNPTSMTYPGATTLTATVTGVSGGADPGGTVAFTINGNSILGCSAKALSNSPPTATCDVSGLPGGPANFGAAYTSGNSNYSDGFDGVSRGVTAATPTVQLSANPPSPGTYPGSTTLTATISGVPGGADPTGTVTFVENGSVISGCEGESLSLSPPSATCGVSGLAGGSVPFELLFFSADENYTDGSPDTLDFTVNAATPSVMLSANPTSSTYPGSTTLTATVSGVSGGADPAGSVTFFQGATMITSCSAELLSASSPPQATCDVSGLAGGTPHFSAAFISLDSNYEDATGDLDFTVNAATPTVVLSANPTSSTFPGSTTLKATVSGVSGGAEPTGTVTFSQGGSPISGCSGESLSSSPPQATCPVSGLAGGTIHFSVAYTSGDSNYSNGSDSLDFSVSGTSAKVKLSASPSSSTYPGSTTLTVKVTGPSGAADPTGTVTFSNGGVAIGSCTTKTLAGSPPKATCAVSGLPVGTTHFSVAFTSGDANYTDGSDTLDFNVGQAATTLTLTASPASPGTYPGSTTLTAKVKGPNGSGANPSGTVDFTAGGNAISAACTTATLSPDPNAPAGHPTSLATCVVTGLPVGTTHFAASYAGDTNYTGGSDTLDFVVNKAAPMVSLAASPSGSSTYGSSVTITATVTKVSGGVDPTGSVSFVSNPGAAPIAGCTGVALNTSVSPPTATCATTGLGTNTTGLSATYNGDGNYTTASKSITYTVNLAPGNVTETIDPPVASIAGNPVTITATIATAGAGAAPTGTVKFTVDGTKIDGCGKVTVQVIGGVATATCTTTRIEPGLHTLKASYSGDGNYSAGSAVVRRYQVGYPAG